MKKKQENSNPKIKKLIHKNKKAYFDYEIIEDLEVGIMLKGCEIKSIRNSNVNLKGSFAKIIKGECFVFDMHVSKYENINSWDKNIEEKRERKLLLNKSEIIKYKSKLEELGYSLIPLNIYINQKNKCKMTLGLCKGKKLYDKRETLKRKTQDMDAKKALKDY